MTEAKDTAMPNANIATDATLKNNRIIL